MSHYKAAKELGYISRPLGDTIRDTYEWFDEHGGAFLTGRK